MPWALVPFVGIALGATVLLAVSSASALGPLLLAAVLALFVAMAVQSLRRLLLAVLVLDTPLQLDVNLGWREAEAELGALGGLNLSVTTVALAALYALWLAEALAGSRDVPRARMRAALPLLAYVGLTGISVIVARDAGLASFELFVLVQTFLLFLYIASTVRTRNDVRFIVALLLVGLLLEGLLMLAVAYSGVNFAFLGTATHTREGIGAADVTRIGGTIGAPNAAGGYLAFVLALAAGSLAASVGGSRLRRIAVLAIAVGTPALLLTLSRGAWLAFALSLVIASMLGWLRGWLTLRVLLGVAALLAVLVFPFRDTLSNRLLGDDEGTARARVALSELAYDIIDDNSVLGVGANNFALAIPDYAGPEFSQEWIYTVHNKYLLVWAEAGFGALLAFLWFLASTIRRGAACVWREDAFLSQLGIALTAAVAGQIAHMFFEAYHARVQLQVLALAAALLTAMLTMKGKPASEGTPADSSSARRATDVGWGSRASNAVSP
jgi:putative inorganic carbon (HCO3(-)) transporter